MISVAIQLYVLAGRYACENVMYNMSLVFDKLVIHGIH